MKKAIALATLVILSMSLTACADDVLVADSYYFHDRPVVYTSSGVVVNRYPRRHYYRPGRSVKRTPVVRTTSGRIVNRTPARHGATVVVRKTSRNDGRLRNTERDRDVRVTVRH